MTMQSISERKVTMKSKSTSTTMSSTRSKRYYKDSNDNDDYDNNDNKDNHKKNRQFVQLFIQQTFNYRIQQYFIFIILIILVTICTIVIIYYFISTTRSKQWNNVLMPIVVSSSSSIEHFNSVSNINVDSINFTSFIHEINNEYLFHNTIKSCYPSIEKQHSCGEYVTTVIIVNETKNDSTIIQPKKKIQRIALITPPGILSNIIHEWMIQIIQASNIDINNYNNKNNNIDEQIPEIQLVHRTNVPPLGYGKTHGLTKIVRIVVRPILYQVYDTLYNVSNSITNRVNNTNTNTTGTNYDTNTTGVTINIIQSTVRQILRFHCRLSQISAHTAIHTIVFNDIFTNPMIVYQQLSQFINNGSKQSTTSSSTQQQQQQQQQQLQPQLTSVTDTVVLPLLENYKKILKYQSISILLNLQQYKQQQQQQQHQQQYKKQKNELQQLQLIVNVQRTVESMLDTIIQNELQSTKNYTAWPCPSFWKVGSMTTNSDGSSSTSSSKIVDVTSDPIVKHIALSLVPICNEVIDPYATCGVHYDQCEATGYIIC